MADVGAGDGGSPLARSANSSAAGATVDATAEGEATGSGGSAGGAIASGTGAGPAGPGGDAAVTAAVAGPEHQAAGLPGGLGSQPSGLPGLEGPAGASGPTSGVPGGVAGPQRLSGGAGGPAIGPLAFGPGGGGLARHSGGLAIDGTVSEPTAAYRHRGAGNRRGLRSGGEGTDINVERGLEFFARLQFPDGHWSLHELPPDLKLDDAALGEMQSDTAATGLVLLTYLGGGYTHLDDKHRTVVRKGIEWLIHHQKPDGDLFSGGTKYARFYSHGIAAIALCEAYGMTQDPELRQPARKAIDFIIKSQHPTRGGWRYDVAAATGQATESDTSVTGWQLMALKSAQMAGLDVPAETLRKIDGWLDRAVAPDAAGRYVYNPLARPTPEQEQGRRPSLAMTAEAMLDADVLGPQAGRAAVDRRRRVSEGQPAGRRHGRAAAAGLLLLVLCHAGDVPDAGPILDRLERPPPPALARESVGLGRNGGQLAPAGARARPLGLRRRADVRHGHAPLDAGGLLPPPAAVPVGLSGSIG